MIAAVQEQASRGRDYLAAAVDLRHVARPGDAGCKRQIALHRCFL
jgi:hypothetical protein